MSDQKRLWHLTSAVARHDRMADLLPLFHQRAQEAAGGRTSVLLRLNPRNGTLQGDSSSGLDVLGPEPWLADRAANAAAERSWSERGPVLVQDEELASRLHAPYAVLAPLMARGRRLGLLVIGVDDRSTADGRRDEIAGIADLLSIALERARARRDADIQQDLRELSANLRKAVASSLYLDAALEVFCDRAARLFAADRVSVWLYDRRARALQLSASSDAAELAVAERLAVDDSAEPVAMAMRRSVATVVPPVDDRPARVLAPLQGHRRALGTLEFAGVRIEMGDAVDLLDRVDEVARHLAGAIENARLIDDVLRSRRELESTFNSLTDLVIVADKELRIVRANRAFTDRVGRAPEELTRVALEELMGTEVVSWVAAWTGASSTGPPQREFTDPRLNGTFLFSMTPLVGSGDERAGTVVVARDVTTQARLAAEKAELSSRLAQSEKLAALGQFVAGIAHELNNPLQGVLGHIELMLQSAEAAPRLKRDLKLVFRDADRAAKIVHNLLVFAGSRRITRRRLNLNRLVQKVLAMRAAACAAAAIDVSPQLAPSLPRFGGDALLLQQALLNIVINAEQAMKTAGSARRLQVTTCPRGSDRIEIVIADTGPGIAPSALPRIFEPFFTTKEVGQGTGLGLAISYGIVQEHGGRLEAANHRHGGAVFTITLPAGSSVAVE